MISLQSLKRIGAWFDQRLQLADPLRETMQHRVPRESGSWFYVFGSAAFTVLLLQVVTGILLALLYEPSAGEAWNSLQVLNHQIPLGWFIRALHGWGSNFMVAIVLIHMVQVFLFGAYKFPRELTWMIGVLLLLLTLGMAFTGQVLRFDQDAYWGLGIGASISSRIPVIGPWIVKLLLGGPIIAGATLSRFFALHVFVIPGMLLTFVGVHLLLVLKLGINEWPMPGRIVRRETYLKDYHELVERDGVPFVPEAIGKDLAFSGFVLLALAACAVVFGPFGPSGQPDPTIIQTVPRPDYFFLWLYAVLSLLPPELETPALLIGPVIALGVLFALPFVSGEGEKNWKRRPIAVLTILLLAVGLSALTHLAGRAPWSPVMDAWSKDPIPADALKGRTAMERQGALVFQAKQCHNCHALGGEGGQRGPALDRVALDLTYDQLVRQVIQGGGNMPAYGKNLNPAETAALVAFLRTLHPASQPAARDASRVPQ
jgi:ubiquinol-cytochrome c reductase cytochrome b subunit